MTLTGVPGLDRHVPCQLIHRRKFGEIARQRFFRNLSILFLINIIINGI
jgi:hypothetical protein